MNLGHLSRREYGPDLRLPGARGGTRTPNLLIRSRVQDVRPMLPGPFPQVRVHRVSAEDARVRCRPTSL